MAMETADRLTARSGLGRYQQYQKYLQRVGFASSGDRRDHSGHPRRSYRLQPVRGFPALSLDLLTTSQPGAVR